MVVATESYQVTSTLTSSAVAIALTDAMEDGGYTLFDTFVSGGIENRVFRVIYDGAKTYGTTYYWFMVTATGVFAQAVSGWNATTHEPTGTQYLDYFSTETNTTNYHLILMTLNTSQTFTIKRYTSGVDTAFSWYVFSQGTQDINFHINKTPPISAIDLDKVFYHSMMWLHAVANGTAASVRFQLFPLLARRSYLGGFMRGIDSGPWYGAASANPWPGEGNTRFALIGTVVHMPGNYNNTGSNANFQEAGIILPYGFANTNVGLSSDTTPIVHSLRLNNYSAGSLPSDFGICANYKVNTMEIFSTFRVVISSAEQRWEMLRVVNSSSAPPGSASPMFLALIPNP